MIATTIYGNLILAVQTLVRNVRCYDWNYCNSARHESWQCESTALPKSAIAKCFHDTVKLIWHLIVTNELWNKNILTQFFADVPAFPFPLSWSWTNSTVSVGFVVSGRGPWSGSALLVFTAMLWCRFTCSTHWPTPAPWSPHFLYFKINF